MQRENMLSGLFPRFQILNLQLLPPTCLCYLRWSAAENVLPGSLRLHLRSLHCIKLYLTRSISSSKLDKSLVKSKLLTKDGGSPPWSSSALFQKNLFLLSKPATLLVVGDQNVLLFSNSTTIFKPLRTPSTFQAPSKRKKMMTW